MTDTYKRKIHFEAAFRRWVDSIAKDVMEYEQERIIKLLEDNWVEPMDWLSVGALIKGEQK